MGKGFGEMKGIDKGSRIDMKIKNLLNFFRDKKNDTVTLILIAISLLSSFLYVENLLYKDYFVNFLFFDENYLNLLNDILKSKRLESEEIELYFFKSELNLRENVKIICNFLSVYLFSVCLFYRIRKQISRLRLRDCFIVLVPLSIIILTNISFKNIMLLNVIFLEQPILYTIPILLALSSTPIIVNKKSYKDTKDNIKNYKLNLAIEVMLTVFVSLILIPDSILLFYFYIFSYLTFKVTSIILRKTEVDWILIFFFCAIVFSCINYVSMNIDVKETINNITKHLYEYLLLKGYILFCLSLSPILVIYYYIIKKMSIFFENIKFNCILLILCVVYNSWLIILLLYPISINFFVISFIKLKKNIIKESFSLIYEAIVVFIVYIIISLLNYNINNLGIEKNLLDFKILNIFSVNLKKEKIIHNELYYLYYDFNKKTEIIKKLDEIDKNKIKIMNLYLLKNNIGENECLKIISISELNKSNFFDKKENLYIMFTNENNIFYTCIQNEKGNFDLKKGILTKYGLSQFNSDILLKLYK